MQLLIAIGLKKSEFQWMLIFEDRGKKTNTEILLK